MLHIPAKLMNELQTIKETCKDLGICGLIASLQREVLEFCDYDEAIKMLSYLQEDAPELIDFQNATKQLRRAKTSYQSL